MLKKLIIIYGNLNKKILMIKEKCFMAKIFYDEITPYIKK